MRKMSKFCTRKMVILLDSLGNNPVTAKRLVRRFSYKFLLYDENGNQITEEQAARKKGRKYDSKERKNE